MAFVTEETIDGFVAENRYLAGRMLPDGSYVAVVQMIFNLRLIVGADDRWADDAWCYHDPELCWQAYAGWDGTGDPPGWYKHLGSGRRRPDFTEASEYVAP